MTFEEYYEYNREMLNHWTERGQEIIYKCDQLAYLNSRWVVARMNNNEYIQIYQSAIGQLRNMRNRTEQQEACLKDFKQRLFKECMDMIREYCLN